MSLEQLKSTGNPDIDGTHELIICMLEEIINCINNGDASKCLPKIRDLLTICNKHFKEEEQLMKEIEYPYMESHFSAHNDIILKLLNLNKLCEAEYLKVGWLLSGLESIIKKHVEYFDVPLFKFNTLIINTRLV